MFSTVDFFPLSSRSFICQMTWSMTVLDFNAYTTLALNHKQNACHCIKNTGGKWIWKVYYLFIHSFIQFPLFKGEQVCRNLHFCNSVRRWICASKNGTPLCSSMSAPVCSSTQGVWIFISDIGFDGFVVTAVIQLEQELCIGILLDFEWCCW